LNPTMCEKLGLASEPVSEKGEERHVSPGATAWLVTIAAGLSLVPIWLNYDIIARDGAFQYIPTAMHFLQGRFIEGFTRPQPLFPLLIAGVSWITGLEPELSGQLVSVAASMLACLGMFRLGELIFQDRWVGFLAVVFLAANRELAVDSVDCLKESLLVCCVLWGNYFVLRGIDNRGRAWLFFLAGALIFFLGIFIRSTVFFFIGAWLLLWAFHRKDRRLVRTALMAIPAAAFIVLWYFNPDWPLFRKSYDLGLIFNQDHTLSGVLLGAWRAVVEFFATGNPLVILMGCLGLGIFWEKHVYYVHLCLAMGMFLAVLTGWGFTSGRYLLALMAWIYPLAAYTTLRMLRSGHKAAAVFGFLAVISAVGFWVDKALEDPDPTKLARRDAGLYILEHFGPGMEIVTNRDRLAFYAQGICIPFKNARGVENPGRIFAVDVEEEGGADMKKALDASGKEPSWEFGTIVLYFPESSGVDEHE